MDYRPRHNVNIMLSAKYNIKSQVVTVAWGVPFLMKKTPNILYMLNKKIDTDQDL
jgi:hypothetical protein